MVNRETEPLFWILFSAGGVVAALFLPVQLFLFGIAIPLGWVHAPHYSGMLRLVESPITRLYLFVLCSLPLFHFAHRFRYTLYDGLQIKHLNEIIFAGCYGIAILGTLAAAFLLLRI
ncbi:MAG TPA: fumarate reductase subunit FrdD [Terriglobales bacterium]|nr:fumarate reductase subunit FrdD [Terriglobales bacterium]